MSDIPFSAPVNLAETVAATVVDAAGSVLRFVSCPRGALHLQLQPGEEIVEREIRRGKRWDKLAQAEVDADQPAPPADPAEFDAVAWRWISKGEKNIPFVRRMELLERAQDRAVREFLLGDITQVEGRVRLRAIDDAIAALRAQLL